MQLGERQLGEVRRTGRSASNGPGETMFRSVYGVARGLRLSMFGAVAVVTVLAVATEPADARRHRRSGGHASHSTSRDNYSPPYSAIVVDANSGKTLHEASADGLRHPASLTKIMTLYLLFERLDAGKMKLDKIGRAHV